MLRTFYSKKPANQLKSIQKNQTKMLRSIRLRKQFWFHRRIQIKAVTSSPKQPYSNNKTELHPPRAQKKYFQSQHILINTKRRPKITNFKKKSIRNIPKFSSIAQIYLISTRRHLLEIDKQIIIKQKNLKGRCYVQPQYSIF